MPDPTNIPELRRWLGMVNYLGRFLPDLSEHPAPLNALLHIDECWIWEQRQRGKKVKEWLIQAPTLEFSTAPEDRSFS